MENYDKEKKVGLFELIMLGIASLTGATIFSVLSPATVIAGPATMLALFLGAIIACIIAGIYGELVSVYPKSGGGFVFIAKAYGEKANYIGWITWLANMAYGALASYTSSLFIVNLFQFDTILSVPIGIGIALLMMSANLFGSKVLTKVEIPLTIGLLSTLTIGAIYLLLRPDPTINWNFDYFLPFGILSVFPATALLFNMFIGFEDIGSIAEEAKNPQKNLPKAFFLMLIVATLFYFIIMLSLYVSTPVSEITKSELPVLDFVRHNYLIFFLVYLGAIFGLLTSAGVALMAASRNVYALSKRDFLTRKYSELDEKSGAPKKALFLSTLITCLILTSGQVKFFASISTISYMIQVIFLGFTIFRFRKTEKYTEETFKIPFHPYTTIIGIIFAFVLIVSLEIESILVSFFWIPLGLILYLFFNSKRRVYGTIFLVTAFFFAITSIIMGIIIVSIGFIYYLLTISDRSSVKLILAGIKAVFVILTLFFIWLIRSCGQVDAVDKQFIPIFNGLILNLLIFACVVASISIILELVPLKEWIYFIYKKSAKKEVAIKIGDGHIIDLKISHQKLINYSNDILGYLQVVSLGIVFLIVGLIMSDIVCIGEITLGSMVFSQEASSYLFTLILSIFGILIGLSGALSLYFSKESKKIGV